MAIKNYHWLVIVVVIAGLWYVSTNLTIEGQDNTVVVTQASPDISVNGVDYKYGQFNLNIGDDTTTWVHYQKSSCNYDCTVVKFLSDIAATSVTQKNQVQLIGKWAGHEADISIKEVQQIVTNSHFAGSYITQGGLEMYNAYYDALYIPVAGSYTEPQAIPAQNSQGQTLATYNGNSYPINLDGNYVGSNSDLGYSMGAQYTTAPNQDWAYTPHTMWAAVGDVLYKFDISPRSVKTVSGLGNPNWVYYYYGGYTIRARVYVPSKYFEPPRCGDNHCDLGEVCSDGTGAAGMCSADCGVCQPTCGDGIQQSGESCTNCPQDWGACPIYCGNGVCDKSNESCVSCASDCGSCGSPPPDSPQLPLINQTHPPIVPANTSCTSDSQCSDGACVQGRCVEVAPIPNGTQDWFSQDTLINGIPNWQILAIAALIILAYVKRKQIKKWL